MSLPVAYQPWVHIVGDSISIQYGPFLEQYLAGAYRYTRKSGEEEALVNLDIPQGANGGDSGMVLRYLEACFEDTAFRPDLLLVNCGLHDIKTDPESNVRQVALADYEANLKAMLNLAKRHGVPFAWVRTTHCVDAIHNANRPGFLRYASDCDAYDAAALRVMAGGGIPVADLRRFTLTLGAPEEIFIDHVHFTPAIREKQGAFLAGWLDARKAYTPGSRK